MLYFRRSRLLRSIVLLTLVTFLPACHKWVPLNGALDQAISSESPDLIRVIDIEGEQFELKSPWIQDATLVGLPRQAESRQSGDVISVDTVRVELAEVNGIEVRGSNGLGTAGVVVGGIGALLVAFGLAMDFQ